MASTNPQTWCVAATLAASLLIPTSSSNAQIDMARIEGGTFAMGSNHGLPDERPVHRQTVRSFYMDKRPVTNAEFAEFLNSLGTHLNAKGQRLFDIDDEDAEITQTGKTFKPKPGKAAFPVVEASWHGALAFCRALNKRLPTEAEWEFAARGTSGRTYPWGAQSPDASRARYNAGWGETVVAGSLTAGATPEGVHDLAGNVHEWTSSLAKPYPYDARDGRENLARGGDRVTRGGAADTGPETLRATWRGANVSRNPRSGHHNIGFRCAKDAS